MSRPVVLLDPAPRVPADIFTDAMRRRLESGFEIVERGDRPVADFLAAHLPRADFIIGQPPLDAAAIDRAPSLRAVINVEGNFLQNMDYAACFGRGIHVLGIGPVFARPVAELALGLALALARDIPAAHTAFGQGDERYGLDGNHGARLLHRCTLGFIGFGDLGRAILKVFAGFEPRVLVHDPWLSPEVLRREGLEPASLDTVLATGDVVPVVASVTDDSRHMLGREQLARLRPGALLLILSRAEVVDFEALREACASGRIRAATDVLPQEPLPADSPLRGTPNLLLSAHRAGALTGALHEIGERVVADLELMAAGLPPQNCKRAERELVSRARSRPVERS